MSRGTVIRSAMLGAIFVAAVLSVTSCAVAPATAQEARGPQRTVVQQHIEVDFDIPCAECHSRRTPAVVQQWQESKHSPNVGCFICHGDGEVEFNPKPNTNSCMTCHAAKVEDMRRAPVQNCFACHNSHRLKFH
jgi:hypothetical protein